MRYIRPDHFHTGVWASDGPLRLRSHTCLACGVKSKTWDDFREHRRSCTANHPEAAPPPRWLTEQQERRPTSGAPLSADDMALLADLLDQVDGAA